MFYKHSPQLFIEETSLCTAIEQLDLQTILLTFLMSTQSSEIDLQEAGYCSSLDNTVQSNDF